MNHTIIIKIESGIVSDIYSTDPIQVIVVDYDLIEGNESCEHRMIKAVHVMSPDGFVKPEEIDSAVKLLVAYCSRPARPITSPEPLGASV